MNHSRKSLGDDSHSPFNYAEAKPNAYGHFAAFINFSAKTIIKNAGLSV